jgi:hypothetical protein
VTGGAEITATSRHEEVVNDMRSVVEAFRNALVTNPDGNNGINARRYVFHYALAIHVDTVRPLYSFGGFFSPVDNLPTLNVVKAGSSVPVGFSLGGDYGLDVLVSDSPWSGKIPTDPTATLDNIEETVTAGSSGLSYAGGPATTPTVGRPAGAGLAPAASSW